MVFRDKEGRCYHVQVKPGEINPNILIPGSPERVEKIAEKLENAEKIAHHRGILVINGKYRGMPVTAINSGMGPASASIVCREAIESINFEEHKEAKLVRVGTAGSMQPYVKVGDIVVSGGCIRDEDTTRKVIGPEYPAISDQMVTLALASAAKDQGYTLGENLHLGVHHVKSELYAVENHSLSAIPQTIEERMKSYERMGALCTDMEASAFLILADWYNSEWRKQKLQQRIRVGCVLLVVSPHKEWGEKVEFEKPSQEDLIKIGLEGLYIANNLEKYRNSLFEAVKYL